MKCFILLALIFSSSAFAISHKEFVKLPRAQREKIIVEYKNFLREYSKTVEVASIIPLSFPQFIEAAYASDADCVYGGWPSHRVKGLCSLPRTNPAFQKESCGEGEMPCQPLLFSRGVCVPNLTRAQKRSAFANCEKKTEEMGKKISDVVEYISDPEVSQEADELFRLVDEICKTGAQASTPMCRNLRARVAEIKAARPKVTERRPPQTPPQTPQVALTVAATGLSQVNRVVSDLNSTTRCETCDAMRANTVDEPERTPAATTPLPEPIPANNTSYPRINSEFDLADCEGLNGTTNGYFIGYIHKCSNKNDDIPSGWTFYQTDQDQYLNVQSPYPNGAAPTRKLSMVSINNAFNETYLNIEETGGGPDSHDVKSYMFVIPRKTVPSVRTEGNNLILTLPTGETVTMDKNSRAILGGPLTEGP
ncbi:MAG: hypothetical protein ACJ76H_07145, partial [Bacteriovoracaceae bacterium]